MKLTHIIGAGAALLGAVAAQTVPSKVTILTPREGSSVGVNGMSWMVDVVVSFSPSDTATATAAAAAATKSSSNSGGISYKKRAANADAGFFPFLNSPNLTSFAPGADPAAPGFVCLVSTAANPQQNFGGVFQLNAITNSDANGNILEAYFSWYVSSASFGLDKNATVTAFFVKGTAPATYTGDPSSDANVISNVATTSFTIFGKDASTTTAPSTMPTPLDIVLFTPRDGEAVGVNGSGWMIDMVIANQDTKANIFAPANGFKPLYHDNFSDSSFAPGVVSESVPGLVVLSNTSTLAGGSTTNLANLFQINAITGVQNGVITEYWCTWLVGSAFAGTNQPSSVTIFVVNGTAPTHITGSLPTNIISNIVTANFTLTGAKSGSTAPAKANSGNALRISTGALVLVGLALML